MGELSLCDSTLLREGEKEREKEKGMMIRINK